MIRLAFVLAAAVVTALLVAHPHPETPVPSRKVALYDEHADANRDFEAAVTAAREAGKRTLVVFGANWCPDCRRLHGEFTSADVADAIAQHYVVVHVDVGRFNRNGELASRLHLDIRRGIPAIAVVAGDGVVVEALDGKAVDEVRAGGASNVAAHLDAMAATVPASR